MFENEFLNIMFGFLVISAIFFGPMFLVGRDKNPKNPEYNDNLPWHGWLSIAMIIGGAFFFIIIPGKPLYYLIGNIAVIVIGLLIAIYAPYKENKKEKG